MSTSPNASLASPAEPPAGGRTPGAVLLHVLLLTAGTLLLYRGVIPQFLSDALYDPEKAVLATLPLLIAVWVWRRRDDLAAAIRSDWLLGAAIWLAGIAAYAAFSWPFNYHQPRVHAFTIMLAGIIAFCGGRRLLFMCAPVVALAGLAIPVGERLLNALLGRFESLVIDLNVKVIGLVPGVDAERRLIDILYTYGGEAGTIALGTPDRGIGTLLPLLGLGVLIVFARRRAPWQFFVALAVLPAIALAGSFLRLLTWSLDTILFDVGAIADGPRLFGTVIAFLWMWIAMSLVTGVLGRFGTPPDLDVRSREGAAA